MDNYHQKPHLPLFSIFTQKQLNREQTIALFNLITFLSLLSLLFLSLFEGVHDWNLGVCSSKIIGDDCASNRHGKKNSKSLFFIKLYLKLCKLVLNFKW